MRALIINPWLRTVTETAIKSDSLQDIYENLTHDGQALVDDFNIVTLAKNVSLYVDGEGFLKPDQPVFRILGYTGKHGHLPLAGKAILFGGCDTSGSALGLPDYISHDFAFNAVHWSTQFSTGQLESTTQSGNTITIGKPILREAF